LADAGVKPFAAAEYLAEFQGGALLNSRSSQIGKPTEMDIVRRAYELCQQAGKPQGKDQEFYHQAERELRRRIEGNFRRHLVEKGRLLETAECLTQRRGGR
jgi:hypothetical protein